MGLIRKSAIYNSSIQYLGIALGYVNIVVLFPLACSTEEFGLTRLLLSMAVLFSQVSNLGINKSLVKLFPVFKSEDRHNGGILAAGLLSIMVGFAIFTFISVVFKDEIVSYFAENSELFLNYYSVYIPLTAFILLNITFESYLQALRHTVFTNFLKNVFVRIVIAAELIALILGWVTFDEFIYLFVLAYFSNTLISVGYLIYINEIGFKIDRYKMNRRILKYGLTYTSFAALSGISAILINHIDKIMIGAYIGLSDTGIYAMAAYVTAIVNVPARALGRITLPVLSAKYKLKDMKAIQSIYHKTALTQLLIGGYIFCGIWLNVDSLFKLIPGDYSDGKYVILWIGLSLLVNIALGANGQIISLSKHFRFDAITSVLLLLLTVGTNYYFIPRYGINGAAFATFTTLFIYNLIKYLFLRITYKLTPFGLNTISGLGIILIPYLITFYIPIAISPLIDIIFKSMLFSVLCLMLVWWLKPSTDIDSFLRMIWKKGVGIFRLDKS